MGKRWNNIKCVSWYTDFKILPNELAMIANAIRFPRAAFNVLQIHCCIALETLVDLGSLTPVNITSKDSHFFVALSPTCETTHFDCLARVMGD